MTRLITLMLLFWAVPAMALDAESARISDDVALTKATISPLAGKDLTAFRERRDPRIGQASDDKLRQMSDLNRPRSKRSGRPKPTTFKPATATAAWARARCSHRSARHRAPAGRRRRRAGRRSRQRWRRVFVCERPNATLMVLGVILSLMDGRLAALFGGSLKYCF